MPKFSQVTINAAPATTDYMIGVTVGGVDMRVTLAQLAVLMGANIPAGSVKATQVDWAAATGKVWWEELGRTTLAVAGDTIAASFTAKKYLRLLVSLVPTGGTINGLIRFNSDSAANYAVRYSVSGGADTTAVSQSSGWLDPGVTAQEHWAFIDIVNIAAQEKLAISHTLAQGTAGAANAPVRAEHTFKWANTSAQISSLSILNSAGTGDFAIGSEVIVLGHN